MRYHSIQTARAVAVLLVLVLHSQLLFKNGLYHIPVFSDFGWLGVRFFFVISGFIIAERIHLESSLARYLLRRYLRVFPLYAFITVIALFLSAGAGLRGFSVPRTDSGAAFASEPFSYLFKSLLIIPQDEWPVFMVGWSLEYEVVFYFTFGVAYFLGGRAVALGSMVGLSIAGLALPGLLRPFYDSFFVYFLLGCLSREVIAHGNRPLIHASPYVSALCALICVLYLYEYIEFDRRAFVLLSGLSFAALIVWWVFLEQQGNAFRRPGMLTRMGDMSFSIYLVHWLVVVTALNLMSGATIPDGQKEPIRIAVVMACLAISWVVWNYVERPANRLLQTAVFRRSHAVA